MAGDAAVFQLCHVSTKDETPGTHELSRFLQKDESQCFGQGLWQTVHDGRHFMCTYIAVKTLPSCCSLEGL